MTTLLRDPNTGGFQLPNNPNQGLAPGVTGSYNPQSTALTFNILDKPSLPPPVLPPAPLSVSDLLTKILQDSQKNAGNQYTGNNTALLGGKEAIQGTNAGVYSQDLANANITNEARLSLLNNDQNLQSPGLKSIADQQSMNEHHYTATNDAIKAAQDAYDKAQQRLLDLQKQAETVRHDKADEANTAYKNGVDNENNNPTTGSSAGTIAGDVQDILEGRNTMYNIRQTMGRTNKAAVYMQSIRDQIRKVDPQFDFVASDAGGKSVSTSYVQRATATINAVLPNVDKIIDLSNQVGRIGVTGVDKVIQGAGLVFNNKKVANFHQAQQLISDEIGVALGAGTVSDMKLQLGFNVTNPNVSADVFASNMNLIKGFLNNRKDGLNSLRYASSTTNANFRGAGTNDSGSLSVTDPNGTVHTFPDKTSLEAFKKATGL